MFLNRTSAGRVAVTCGGTAKTGHGAFRSTFSATEADHETLEPAATVCPHHDEIGGNRDRLGDDGPEGVTNFRSNRGVERSRTGGLY
jgi:hypothetical protein